MAAGSGVLLLCARTKTRRHTPKPGPRAFGGLVGATLLALLIRDVHAAACCVSATSFGVGRLLIWEDFAVGLQLGHARLLGQWDENARLHTNPPGYSEGISHAQLWVIVRLHERAELQGWLPALENDRWSEDAHQIAGGIGDAGAAIRLQLLRIGEIYRLPSLALIASGFAPSGRRVEETSPPLFAGTTGLGAWGGSLAIESEYAPSPWFVRLEAGVTGFLSFRRADNGQRQGYGPLVRATISSGREVVPGTLVAAGALTGEWQSKIELNGVDVPSSQAHLFSCAASLSWRFDPHWTAVASLLNTVWPRGFGMNRDARVDVTLGVRYGHF